MRNRPGEDAESDYHNLDWKDCPNNEELDPPWKVGLLILIYESFVVDGEGTDTTTGKKLKGTLVQKSNMTRLDGGGATYY
ncbi:hypothetical protein KEM48_007626 [Puccinia striiformis f. sp. tritici PST-130]|nr:hypothetical protein H4Q26_007754 [Puccinia striiformis f. sp. tritici PST-130]KAI9621697.1 hypothetical protein KEM48_007626 [Puccinia striiformis f. sp. tritici PST-130]